MATGPSIDPLTLEPAEIAFHQLETAAAEPFSLVEALERSPLFRVERLERAGRAEWVRTSAETAPSFFPLGCVTVHPRGILLEALCEERMTQLRRRVNDLGSWWITRDQVRILRLEHVLERPEALMQPLHELSGESLDSRGVATMYLRMAWPFLPREDFGGRAPHALLRTGRGRSALEERLEEIGRELTEEIRFFPAFTTEELREILFPLEPPARVETREARPRPADERGK